MTVPEAPAPAPAPPRSDLDVQVITTLGGFGRLRAEWTLAVGADPDTNVVLTWEWARTWWEHFGARAELHIVVIRDAEGVVAIAPLLRSRVGAGATGAPTLQRIAHDAGDYGGIVLVRREAEAVSALVDHLADRLRRGDVAVVVLSRLASDTRFSRVLGDELASRSATLATRAEPLEEACLFTDVREGFDLAKQAKKHKIRQRVRRLEEHHGAVRIVGHTGDTLEVGLDRLIDLHEARWAEIDEPMRGLLAGPATQAFLLDAIRMLDAEHRVRLFTLEAAGRPVAVELDLQLGRCTFLFKGAFDPGFAAFSPGQLLTHHVFQEGLAQGVEVFDFCRGDPLYKRRWTNGERHLTTVSLTRAGIAGELALRRFKIGRAIARRWPRP